VALGLAATTLSQIELVYNERESTSGDKQTESGQQSGEEEAQMKQERAILDRFFTVRMALGLSFRRLLLPIYMLRGCGC